MKKAFVRLGLAAVVAGALAACATVPNGPSVLVLPGTGKTFDQFRADDLSCRDFAMVQIGGQSAQAASEQSGVRSAAIGTAVGALAGVAIGGSRGAGVGAGTGLIVGSAAGADAGQSSAYGSQRRYDHAYIQCMYAKGHRVPVSGQMGRAYQQPYYSEAGPAAAVPPAGTQPPAGVRPPPPPPGAPPPPPPGATTR